MTAPAEPLLPPGTTERVNASSALVLAPHYDDEVLGCGGLVAQLTAAGAVVRVLFLSDGGGRPVGDGWSAAERDAYRARRKAESAAALQALGVVGADHLDLPDGGLGERLPEIAQGISRAVLSQRPDLLLAPSPLEVSRDHRAAFAGLHRLLSAVRPGAAEPAADSPWDSLAVLLYEVNHAAYPDLLVDVTAQVPRLEAAMAAYASQEEQHGYLNAALGLRRFRCHSLPPTVALAEGYRRLALGDFTTRSLAQLVRHLGGVPELHTVLEGPRLSVIVRTKDRPELLAEALGSLAAGTYRRVEVVLVNDGGAPPSVPADYPFEVVRVDLAVCAGRAAAAQAGVEAATGDYVTFLDDDDLAAPEHLATLAGLVGAAGVRVAYTDTAVGIYELGATGWVCSDRRLPYSRDFDRDLLAVDNYIPFNTLAIERGLFAEVGAFDPSLPFFEDWDLLIRLAGRTAFHHHAQVTCEYRHFRNGGHHIFGERPRERGDFLAVKARVLTKHLDLLPPATLARVVDLLRADAVEAQEAHDAARRDAAEARRETLGVRVETEELRRSADAARQATEVLRQEFAGRQEEFSHRYGEVAWQLDETRRDLANLRAAHDALGVERFRYEELYHQSAGGVQALRDDLESLTTEVRRLYGEETRLHEVLAGADAEVERLRGRVRKIEASLLWRLKRHVDRWRHGRGKPASP